MAKYYCILFDADNTLLDFDAAENKALAETLVEYGIEPDAGTVQTYRDINSELWRQLEKGQIRRDKLMGERFTRFLKAINAAGDGVEMNRCYLDHLSSHPDLMTPNVPDVLGELSEVATLAIVTNGFEKVQSRRVAESGIGAYLEDVFVSEKLDSEKPSRRIFDSASALWAWRTGSTSWWWATASPATFRRRERGPRHLLVQPRPRREPGQGEPHLRDRLAGRALPAGDGAGRTGEPRPQAPPSSAVTAGMSRSTYWKRTRKNDMLIHLEKLGKSFGEKVVLHDVSASVEKEDRIGIVGQNGAGKTTLLKILTGVYTDYDGEFSVTHGVTLGYLEQNAKLDVTLDIYGEMRSSFAPVLDAMAQMQILEKKMAASPDDDALLEKHDELQNIIDAPTATTWTSTSRRCCPAWALRRIPGARTWASSPAVS